MADFSPIKAFRIKNFRNLGDVTMDFEKSPIITLTGENEAGKTSVVKALAVIGVNAYPNRQAKYIRTGTNGFGIMVQMQDGSWIMRQKGGPAVGNTLAVGFADGTEVKDDKIERGEGVPAAMQKLMGFVVEPETGEMLNIRTYEDQMLFVTTPDSVNYKVLYDALKVGQVTRAIKNGNKQSNELRAYIDTLHGEMQGIESAIRSIRILDIDPVMNIAKRVEAEVTVLGQIQETVKIAEAITKIQADLDRLVGTEFQSLQPVDLRVVDELTHAMGSYRETETTRTTLEALGNLGSAEAVNVGILNSLEQTMNHKAKADQAAEEFKAMRAIEGLSIQSLGTLDRLESTKRMADEIAARAKELEKFTGIESLTEVDVNIVGILFNLIQVDSTLTHEMADYDQLQTCLGETVKAIKQAGGNVGVCTNCGGLVVVKDGVATGHEETAQAGS